MKYIDQNIFKFLNTFLFFLLLQANTSCKKYLEAKPDKSLSTPHTIEELFGILNLEENYIGFPIGTEIANDNIYFNYADWDAIFFVDDKNSYIWEGSVDRSADWGPAYKRIFNANVVLYEVEKLNDPVSTMEVRNSVKGSALFYRALNYYELAQMFSPQYSPESSTQQLGIPLRLLPDLDQTTMRSSVQQTYDQIISDLKESIRMLPTAIDYKTRPSRAAAYALLSRVYLVMNDFVNAELNADSALSIYSELIDYNDQSKVDPASSQPFQILNEEVIFHASTNQVFDFLSARVDSSLYSLYSDNDIRKVVYFEDYGDGTRGFKGSYLATYRAIAFCGITTDEVYLIKAECLARVGNTNGSMSVLNTLLSKRWITGTFVPFTASNSVDALKLILTERRKELCFRSSLRWSDLRRLNRDVLYRETLIRVLNGQTYSLPPNDLRYTFLIPKSVVQIAGIQQNPR